MVYELDFYCRPHLTGEQGSPLQVRKVMLRKVEVGPIRLSEVCDDSAL